ncbi:SRPBCC family protein [Jiangella alba]|uniref:Polyketide cyclase / dehydrase and lipid transport n=1 Tax=Jiangella alba TaxID=561176 RepID=A0A1H5PBQ0_9ACTN|nr:SRPBCC family protein [Jiangella alba]SEF11299.1 Polyketide cyclase / dehydrase and lipid transport [Jiangella alba]
MTVLPFVDEHQVLVPAPPSAVWAALGAHVGGMRAAGALSWVLGTTPRRSSGVPLEPGATVPGFAVAAVQPERLVRLAGRHRFSHYALTFTLAAAPGGTTVSARTEAAFPGPHGRAYRLLVITSGAHRLAVARILRDVRERASVSARP